MVPSPSSLLIPTSPSATSDALPSRKLTQEDAATAEIARCQLWSWVKHGAALDDGEPITLKLVAGVLEAEAVKLASSAGGKLEKAKIERARMYLLGEIGAAVPAEFLTSCVRQISIFTLLDRSLTDGPPSFP